MQTYISTIVSKYALLYNFQSFDIDNGAGFDKHLYVEENRFTA